MLLWFFYDYTGSQKELEKQRLMHLWLLFVFFLASNFFWSHPIDEDICSQGSSCEKNDYLSTSYQLQNSYKMTAFHYPVLEDINQETKYGLVEVIKQTFEPRFEAIQLR